MSGTSSKDDLSQRILQALGRRDVCSHLDAYRVVNSMGDGVPGLYLDKLGPALVAHIHGINDAHCRRLEDELSNVQEGVLAALKSTTIYSWIHSKSSHQTAKVGARRLCGPELLSYKITEGPLSLIVKPEANVNGGALS